MAITWVTYSAISALFNNGHLPKVNSILEFGEANWYGDVPVEQLVQDIETLSLIVFLLLTTNEVDSLIPIESSLYITNSLIPLILLIPSFLLTLSLITWTVPRTF